MSRKSAQYPFFTFSNHWKFISGIFQSLEPFFRNFPIIGTFSSGFSNDWKTGCALLAVLLCAVGTAQAATQTLGGDEVEGALRIECGESGMRVYAYLDGVWKTQTFSDNKSSMVHYEQGGTFKYTAGYYQGSAMTCTKNENLSSTVNERIWTGGSVQLTMRTIYVSPAMTESYEFEIKNTSGSALSNVKLFHGQDTYLGYSDAGGGFWNGAQGVVGVKKPAQDNPNRLIYQTLGSSSTMPNDYASAGYGTVAGLVAQGALNHTLDTNYFTDNGYAVQWNRGTLAPGQTWTIAAAETMAVGAGLTATLPSAQIGTSVTVTGVLQNAGDTAAGGTLSVSADLAGWTAVINGSTNFSLSAGASRNVSVTITCPAVVSVGQVATVTLKAKTPDVEATADGTFTAVYYDGVALVTNVTDAGAASITERSDFGGGLVGTVLTNTYTLYNGGPSNITLLTNALTGSSRFAAQGLPASLEAGASTNFTVTFDVASYATETATLTLFDHKAWSPFVMNLSGFGFTISTNNGPGAGGNELTVTAGRLGDGADITQVTIADKNATILSQTTNSVTFTVPALSIFGFADIVISSVSEGTQTILDGYLVNPKPYISSVSPKVAEGAGVTVTITGRNLCNGSLADLTNVTICGIAATDWAVNGTTQLVVKTGAGGNGKGNVVVDSISHGRGISYSSFTYGGAKMTVLWTNMGAVVSSGDTAVSKNGTDFGYVSAGRSGERIFTITNNGVMTMGISMVATSGTGAAYFKVVECPTQVAAGAKQTLRIAFSSDVPRMAEAELLFYNNTSNSPFRMNLLAEAITVSPMEGPESGGTTVTLSNMTFGSLGTLESVNYFYNSNPRVGAITAVGTNWLQFVTPDINNVTGWQDGAVMDKVGSRSLLNSFYFNPAGSISTISPSSCSWSGGVQVVIRGANLCAGLDDITSVYLSGVKAASVLSASPTQVVVMAAAGFGDTRISYVNSTQYGTTYGYNNFRYTGLDNSPYSFSTNAGTASGGQALTFTFADMGSPVVVTQVVVNKTNAQVIETGSNSVTFLTPPADWAWRGITNMTLYSEDHGFGSYTCHYGTNLGYRYREHAFIGRPDIQNGVWQGGWTNLGFGLDSSDEVVSLAFGPDGKLYAAGDLDLGYYNSEVAYFENGIWQETGVKAVYMNCMIRQGDYLYVGGGFLTNHYGQSGPRGPILRGSGRDWTPLSYTSATANVDPICYALHHDGTYLYASDYHYSYPDEADVFRYNGSSWTALPDTSFTGKVYALGTYMGRLYRSGDRNTWRDPIPVQYWSGASWPDAGAIDESIYGSYPPRALAFCEFDGDYYMGQAAANPSDADGRKAQLLSRSGTSFNPGWEFVPGFEGMENMLGKDNTGTRALCSDGEYLFAGGVQMWYTPAPPGSNYSCVAAFDGTSWSAIGTQGLTTNFGEWGYHASHIDSMIKTPRGIYAGGWFSRIGTDTNFMTGATNIAFFLFNQTNGLSPQTGTAAGGTQVTIYGGNLGNGTTADVYRVTLCGVDVASIDGVSSTQIVVTTAPGAGTGDAVVYTYDYGIIVQSNVFTYTGGSGLELYNLEGNLFSNGSPAQTAAGTARAVPSGLRVTNEFTLVNPGDATLNITGVLTNGTGAGAFECIWPSSLAAKQTGTVQVVFRPAASGTFTASVQVANSSSGPNAPFVMNLECTAPGLSTNNGPYAGGNTIAVTNVQFGAITNVLVGATQVSPLQSGTNWFTITLPAATSAGTVDFTIQTSDNGDTTLPDIYTYNPAGRINRVQQDAFTIGAATYIDGTSAAGPINIAQRSRHFQYVYTAEQLTAAGIEGPATITEIGFKVYQAPLYPLPNYLMRLKQTTVTNMTGGFQSTDLTVCYSNASYAPIAGIFDMQDFSTTFEWDGQQSLLLDTAFSPVSTANSSGRTYYYPPGGLSEIARHIYANSDQSYVFSGGTISYYLPHLGVRAVAGTHGVSPRVGVTTGGYEVVISGRDLCADDVTRVTLCGVDATEVISADATQVVVRAGAAPGEMSGAVSIYSTSHGVSTLASAFRYAGTYSVLGTDGSLIEGGSAVSEDNGTLFANAGVGGAITNVFAITNNIGDTVTLSSMSFTGANASAFSVSPTNLTVEGHTVSNFAVVFQPDAGGTLEATLVVESDTGNASMNVAGTAWALSSSVGAEEGGISVTITNGAQMGFGDITEVIVGGSSVVPTAQGENWVTITMPGHSAGPVDIVVISDVLGETTLPTAFTYTPAPVIYGTDFVWEELPGLPQALYMHTAFELNDQLYVAGGQNAASEIVTNVYRFDGYRWHDAPGLSEARGGGVGAVLNGAFYYIGGVFSVASVTNVYRFDGTNWTEVAGLPGAVSRGVAGVVDGKIVVAGGWDASDAYRTNAYLFNGTNWTQTVGLPAARAEQGGAVRNGKLYAFGGRNDGSAATFNQYSFNGSEWANEPGLPVVLFGAGAATLNHRVYAFGGSDGSAVKDAVYRYDGIGWTSAGLMPTNLYAAAATFWRGAAYVAGGMDMSIPLHTNLWRLTDGGVSPVSGYPAGGYEVILRGTNLCDGTSNDVEWVTLCGTTAEVISVSATQIVVTAGSASGPQTGNVEIRSTTFGPVIASNAFTYLRGRITLIGTNGADIAEADAASVAAGTDFGSMMVSQARTNIFGIRNTGNAPLTLSAIEGAGQGGPSFTVTEFPSTELAIGATGQITVVCASRGGEQLGELAFRDNVSLDPVLIELGGHTVSVYNVKSYGNGSGLGISETSLAYNTAYGSSPAAQTFEVSNVGSDPLVVSNTIAYAAFGENWLSITPTGAAALAVSGSITWTNSVDVSGLNAGAHVATVSVWSATATNSPLSCVVTLELSQVTQTIIWTNPGTQTYTNETLLDAAVSSGLVPSYAVLSGPGALTNKSYRTYMTYTGSGVVTVVASQAGNLNYTAAENVTQSWDVIRAPGQISLTNLTQEYTGSEITVAAVTTPTGLTYDVTYGGLTSGPTNVGSYIVVADITDPLIYGSTTGTLTITKISQTITFPSIAAQLTNAAVGLAATGGGSGNPVTFAVGPGPGSIASGTNLTFTGVGDVYVVASQAGSGNYNPAMDVTNVVRVFSVTPVVGPYTGGNTIVITNGSFGTITNALVDGQQAVLGTNGSSWCAITVPAATNDGLVTITLQTSDNGDIPLGNAYTYNPQGSLAPSSYEEYRIYFNNNTGPDYTTNTSPDGTFIWTHFYRTDDWKELKTTNGTANGAYIKAYGYGSGTSGGWNTGAGGYDWIASDAASTILYLNSTSIFTNYVVITNLPGSSYQVDVVNSYSTSGNYTNSDTLHSGVWDPTMDADNANYGNWPSGGNTNAGNNLDPYELYTSRSNYVTWADATPSNGALSLVMFKPNQYGNFLNCMRISGYSGIPPATPSSGSWTGGYPVVIGGRNLGDGSDITNVTLCGISATIITQTAERVWVTAGGGGGSQSGDVVVCSTSYGVTVGSNLFTYVAPELGVLGTNGAAIASGAVAGTDNGTQFGAVMVGSGEALTNSFSITNSGNAVLNITGVSTSGADAASFRISSIATQVAVGATATFDVVFDPVDGGTLDAALNLVNDGTNGTFVLNLRGIARGGGIGLETNSLSFSGVYAGTNPASQTLAVTNFGISEFTYTNVLNYSTGSSGWLSADMNNGIVASSNFTVLTNGINLSGVSVGTHTCTVAVTAADATNSPQNYVVTLNVVKADQTISFPDPGTQDTTNELGLSLSASSGLSVTCAVSSGSASISGGTNLVFSGAGSVTVVAYQGGDSNYNAAASVTNSFNVTKAVAGVTLTNLNQTFDGSARTVGSVTSPTGLTVNITYDDSSTAPTNTGSYNVIGLVSDDMYQGGATNTLTVNKAGQTITFPAIAAQNSTNTTHLSATASSGLPVSFAVVSGEADLADGTNLTYRSSGPVLIAASQAGDTNWSPAPTVTNSITVNKTAQSTLIFSPTNTMIYLTTNDLSTTGGSGTGAVTYTVSSGPGAITNDTALFINSGSGTIYVAATKAQDAMYQAQTVTAQVYCARADQEITFPVIADQAITNETLLSAAASSGLSVGFSVVSGEADLSDQTNLTYRGTGVVVIAASQAGNTNWNAAVNVTNSFTVLPVLPEVTTLSASAVDQTTFTSGGDVTFNGGAPVTQRGICWALHASPTIADFLTRDATGTGTYASVARGLSTGTTYYARAYAINEAGAGYGHEISVTTSNTPPPPPEPDAFTWTGAADDQWANAANWYGGAVPSATNYARFYTTNCNVFQVDLDGDQEALGIILQSNATDYVYFTNGSLMMTNADSVLMVATGSVGFEQTVYVGDGFTLACAAGSLISMEAGLQTEGDAWKFSAGLLNLQTSGDLGGNLNIMDGSLYASGEILLSESGSVFLAEGAVLYPRDYDSAAFPGSLTVTNEVPGTPSLVIEGTLTYGVAGSASDELDLDVNTLVLGSNSTLDVTVLTGLVDVTGTYTVATYAGITGTFAQVNGLTAHTLNYGANALTLEPTFVWEGSISSNWNDGLNWLNSGGAVPGQENDTGFRVDDDDITVVLDTNPSVRSVRAVGLGRVTLENSGATLILTNAVAASGAIPALAAQDGVMLLVHSDIATLPGARFLAQGAMFPGTLVLFGNVSVGDGTGHLVLDGRGEVDIMGEVNFAGAGNRLELRGPTLYIGNSGSLGSNGLILTNGGILIATNDLLVNIPMALTGNGGLGAQHSNDTLTVSGDITGGGLLSITGEGTVVLTGSNQVGGVNVEAGRLLVQGSLQSEGNVDVQDGENFGGRGVVGLESSAFLLHIRTGAHFNPGASIGTLTVEGSLTVDGGWTLEVNNDSNDTVNVRDTLTLGAGSALAVTGTPDGVTAYTFATFASRSGAFGSFSVPQNYILTYGATNLVLMPRGNEMGSPNVTRDGGTLNIPVTEDSNTAWSVVNTSSWITVTSGTGGTGTGTVTLVISANDGRERIGIVWIAGRQYTVTQRANRAVYLDFDGDTLADIAVYWPEAGMWYILQSSLNTGRYQPWGWPDSVPAPGDYDGDGLFDVAVYCVTNGMWYIWQSDSESGRTQAWGWEEAEPVPGDYDGDAICDVAVYHAADGRWLIWQSESQTARTQAWGFGDGVPVPGDYDGDGLSDPAVYEATTGTWYIWLSATQTARIQPWGWASAEPIPGDYDGDGLTDVAVYWPEIGQWYAWLSASQSMVSETWGWNAAWPVPADYDGDGIFDRTVYAPSYGMWYLWQSGSQTPRTQAWGFEEAEPVN
ncbi:MAG: choice-of-anchor D domain-containing protein [Kiritimatiellae bacterium]|nr:choice-of-anchor D domain-containing protein [Kiritimatiellia bacterium]